MRQQHSIQIRQASAHDLEAIARVFVDTWRTTSRNLISDEFLQLVANPNRAFHERLGGVTVCEGTIRLGGDTIKESALVWSDLDSTLHTYGGRVFR